jgi:hypothetical protein
MTFMRILLSLTTLALVLLSSSGRTQAQVSLIPADDQLLGEAMPAPVSPASAQIQVPLQDVAAGETLNPLIQRQWLQLDPQGRLMGRFGLVGPDGSVIVDPGARVVLVRDGVLIREALTGPDGGFVFSGMGPGTYGLIARSPVAVAAFALHVLPFGASDVLPSNFDVFGAAAPAQVVDQIVQRHVVPVSTVGQKYYRDYLQDPLGNRRRMSPTTTFQLREGNLLVGRVSRAGWDPRQLDLSGNVAYVLKNGQVVASAPVSREGQFEIPNFVPGVYDLVVAGDDGVAVLGFLALPPGPAVSQAMPTPKFVSTQETMVAVVEEFNADTLSVELMSGGDWYGPADPVIVDDKMMPVAGGGFAGPGGIGGGAGGGGGLGGGGGGLGALLGIAGLAAGIAALATNNDNLPPATQVVP